jgi:hypothetical protein
MLGLIMIILDMAGIMPPAKRYQSAFKAPQYRSAFSSAAALTFDSYTFKKTFCTVNAEGEILLVEKAEPESILVVKGWQKFKHASVPTEGYLSKGFSKYAFQVCRLALLVNFTANIFTAGYS